MIQAADTDGDGRIDFEGEAADGGAGGTSRDLPSPPLRGPTARSSARLGTALSRLSHPGHEVHSRLCRAPSPPPQNRKASVGGAERAERSRCGLLWGERWAEVAVGRLGWSGAGVGGGLDGGKWAEVGREV